MLLDSLIKLVFSTIEFSALVMLSFTVFRIPLRHSLSRIFIISFILSAITIYQRDFADLENYAVLTSIICYILIITFTYGFPFFYALLVCTIGYLTFVAIQMILVVSAFTLNITSTELIQNSKVHATLLQLTSALIIYIIIGIMQYKKIGFMFVVNRFKLKQSLVKYKIFLCGIIIVGMIILQLGIISFKEHSYMISVLVGLVVLLMVGLYISYKRNRLELLQKYDRYKKQI